MRQAKLVLGAILVVSACSGERPEIASSDYEASSAACAEEAHTCASGCIDQMPLEDVAAHAKACAAAISDCVAGAEPKPTGLEACRDLAACHPDAMKAATDAFHTCLDGCHETFAGCADQAGAAADAPPQDPASDARRACVDQAGSCLGGCADGVAACEPPACNVASIEQCLADKSTVSECIRSATSTCAGEPDLSCLDATPACFQGCVTGMRACFDTL